MENETRGRFIVLKRDDTLRAAPGMVVWLLAATAAPMVERGVLREVPQPRQPKLPWAPLFETKQSRWR